MSLPQLTLQSARVRLALTYLSIIMALTIGFSTAFYYQSIHAADTGLTTQLQELKDNLYFTTAASLEQIHDAELSRFRDSLLAKLVLFNGGMLVVGAVASYVLARRSLRPLEEALTSQSRFTSDAAHELRTPLTAMKTEVEVGLRDKKLSTAEARQVLKSNLEEITKLETLTAGLLRLARSSEKIDRSHWQSYKMSEILQMAYSRLADKAKTRGINVVLPKTKAVVCGDPDQLVELFVTLFGNAIKYSHDNSQVRVKVRETERRVHVDVIDQGVGIADIDLPHIFERFYRADRSRTRSAAEGYGLGLSLADAIATVHGGKITVKSEYKKGSVFTVTLPK